MAKISYISFRAILPFSACNFEIKISAVQSNAFHISVNFKVRHCGNNIFCLSFSNFECCRKHKENMTVAENFKK